MLIALPAVAALLLVNLAFGVTSRAAPQFKYFCRRLSHHDHGRHCFHHPYFTNHHQPPESFDNQALILSRHTSW